MYTLVCFEHVRFRLPWEWTGQEAVLQSRATDEKGQVQPARKAWLAQYSSANAYHNHSIVSWSVPWCALAERAVP